MRIGPKKITAARVVAVAAIAVAPTIWVEPAGALPSATSNASVAVAAGWDGSPTNWHGWCPSHRHCAPG